MCAAAAGTLSHSQAAHRGSSKGTIKQAPAEHTTTSDEENMDWSYLRVPLEIGAWN